MRVPVLEAGGVHHGADGGDGRRVTAGGALRAFKRGRNGSAHQPDDGRRVVEDVAGGKAQNPVAGVEKAVLATVVTGDAVLVSDAVVLDCEAMNRVVQVRSREKRTGPVTKLCLYARLR